MQAMRSLLTLPLSLLALLAISCGGSDEAKIEDVLRGYIDAYVDSQPEEMYDLLDSGSQAECPQENFTAFFTAAREALGEREFKIVAIRDVVIDGDTASATTEVTVDGVAAEPTDNTLFRENGEWKLELPSEGGC
jgi:hypothetical protein